MRKVLSIFLLTGLLSAANIMSESSGAAFLENGAAARSEGMGRAFSALAGDLDAYYYNPAGYGAQSRTRLNTLFTKHRNLEDIYYLGYGQKFLDGYAAVNLYSSGVDGIPLTTYDPDTNNVYRHGNVISGGETFSYGSRALLFSYGASLGDVLGSTDFGKSVLYWGVSLKFLQETLYKNNAAGYGLDAGLIYRTGPLSFGWSVINLLEPQLVWDTDSRAVDTVLRRQRFGLAYRVWKNLTISGEALVLPNEVQLGAGAEFRPVDIFAARCGVFTDNYTLGLGLNYLGCSLDYAYTIPQDTFIEATHKISLGYLF